MTFERPRRRPPGVRHQHVHPPELRKRAFRNTRDTLRVSDIGNDELAEFGEKFEAAMQSNKER